MTQASRQNYGNLKLRNANKNASKKLNLEIHINREPR